MFPPVSQPVEDNWARELVDDAASSICVDAQEYVELDTAIQAFEARSNRPLTDFEKYNRVVAKKMILDGELGLNDADTIDLESVRAPLENVPFIRHDLFKFIVLGGGMTLSVFNESQNLVARCGPLGAVLGAVIGVLLYEAAAHPATELMSFYPLNGGYGSYIAMYVNSSLGFGVNCAYWMICVFGAPTQLAITLPMLSQINALNTSDRSYIVWMLYFVALITVFRLLNKRIQIGIVTINSVISVFLVALTLITTWLLSDGRLGPNYNKLQAIFWHNSNGFVHSLFRTEYGTATGAGGRLLQLIDASMLTFRSCSTVDKVYTLISNVRNPRKSMKLTIWYRRLRLLIFLVLPVVSYTMVLSQNDTVFTRGITYPTLEGNLEQSPYNMTSLNSCPLNLTNWKGYENLSTYMPLIAPFARENVCWTKPVLAGVSVFVGLTSATTYYLAATHVLAALLEEGPLNRLAKLVRLSGRKEAAASINLSICMVCFVVGFIRYGRFMQFLTLLQTTYSYLLMPLLCLCYLRFRKAVHLYSGPMIDRSDADWPYRARGGTWCSWIVIIVMGPFCLLQYFFYAIPLKLWCPVYFFAHYFFELSLVVVASIHWYLYRTQIVGIEEINVIAAKRKLDEQEWVEDRVFHRGLRGKVTHKWDAFVRFACQTLRSFAGALSRARGKQHQS